MGERRMNFESKRKRWNNALLHMCPDCRAGSEWIEHTYEDKEAIGRQDVESECQRCGYTQQEVIRV